MDQINKELYREVIEDQLERISSMTAGSEDKVKEVDCLVKCTKAYAEYIEAEARCDEIRERIGLEKEKQLLEARVKDDEREHKIALRSDATRDMWVNFGLQAGMFGIKLIAYTLWQERGYVFEETQSQRSPWLKNLSSSMGQVLRLN